MVTDSELITLRIAKAYSRRLHQFLEDYENSDERSKLAATVFEREILPNIWSSLEGLAKLGLEHEEAVQYQFALTAINPHMMSQLMNNEQYYQLLSHTVDILEQYQDSYPFSYTEDDSEVRKLLAELLRTRATVGRHLSLVEQSIADYEMVIKLFEEDEDIEAKSLVMVSYALLADLYRTSGNNQVAYQHILQALEIAENYQPLRPRDTNPVYSNLALILQSQGKIDQAYEILKDIDPETSNESDKDVIRMNQALLEYAATGNQAALNHLEQMIAKARQDDDDDLVAAILNNLGESLRTKGYIEEALTRFEEVESIQRKLKNFDLLAMTLSNISLCYLMMGEFQQAQKKMQEAVQLFEEIESWLGLAITTNTQATLYTRMAEFPSAIMWMNRSIEYRHKLESPEHIAQGYAQLGMIYYEKSRQNPNQQEAKKDLNTALANLQSAKKSLEGTQLPYVSAMIDANIAEIYRLEGRISEAKTLFLACLTYAEEANNILMKGTIYNNLSALFIENSDPVTARDYIDKAIALHIETLNYEALMISYVNAIDIHKELNNLDAAITAGIDLVKTAERMPNIYAVELGMDKLFGIIQANPATLQSLIHKFLPVLELLVPFAIKHEQVVMARGTMQLSSVAYGLQGKFESIVKVCSPMLELFQKHNDVEAQAATTFNLSIAYSNLGEDTLACQTLGWVIQIIEQHRLDPMSWAGVPLHLIKARYHELNC